jgi:hypothetical protein
MVELTAAAWTAIAAVDAARPRRQARTMPDRETPPPAKPKPQPKEDRLARALRANLGRRKAQSRERDGEPLPKSQKRD